MKAKKLKAVVTLLIMTNLLFPMFASAESLDTLNEKESAAMRQGEEISRQVQATLDDVNAKYAEVEKLKEKISDNENSLKEAQSEIKVTEQNIERRKEAMAERLQDIQLNGGTERTLQALVEADDFGEFFNRAYGMSVMQNAEKEKVTSLNEEKAKLEDLQAEVKATQATLKDNQVDLESEMDSLSGKISGLKQQLAENEAVLSQIAQSKEVEQARIQAEAARKERAAKEAAEAKAAQEKAAKEAEAKKKADEANKAANTKPDTSNDSSTGAGTTAPPAESTDTGNSGNTGNTDNGSNSGNTGNNGSKTLYVESTAYSYTEAGASFYTATGIDLRKNPMVIAVDPNVIPLGSIVEVQGYGIAVAGDTGGAIKGNIVDVHFPTRDQCLIWGRRYNVKVTIM
ncbi:peptidase M23 [Enterococcus sp. JM4C]|uniref:3D domain-containing protein n=1 Tax=Candidatus Enterococcus huntleyi TaxID=1857217 RepID=UPI00137A8401|nr:3D domain-containing protein [Enterococcus sp. JM4C]KAF1298830.1 peptidase M23 [Enterococcus sp. JM4C]